MNIQGQFDKCQNDTIWLKDPRAGTQGPKGSKCPPVHSARMLAIFRRSTGIDLGQHTQLNEDPTCKAHATTRAESDTEPCYPRNGIEEVGAKVVRDPTASPQNVANIDTTLCQP